MSNSKTTRKNKEKNMNKILFLPQINYSAVKELELEIDEVDITILCYIKFWLDNKKSHFKIVNNEKYVWINYKSIINFLPKKRGIWVISNKLKKLKEIFLVNSIQTFNKSEPNKILGSKIYFYIPKNIQILLFSKKMKKTVCY